MLANGSSLLPNRSQAPYPMSLTRSPPAGSAIVIGSPSNVIPSHHEPSAFWIELTCSESDGANTSSLIRT